MDAVFINTIHQFWTNPSVVHEGLTLRTSNFVAVHLRSRLAVPVRQCRLKEGQQFRSTLLINYNGTENGCICHQAPSPP